MVTNVYSEKMFCMNGEKAVYTQYINSLTVVNKALSQKFKELHIFFREMRGVISLSVQ